MKKGHLSPRLIACILAVVGLVIYSNAFTGEFVSDDRVYIVGNEAITHFVGMGQLWHAFNTRFFLGLTFLFNHWLGGLNVFGYHAVNIFIHIVNAYLVYTFVCLTFRTPNLKNNRLKKHRAAIGLFSALIFLCHPIQTQAVAFITQRAVSLATMFYLITLIYYIKTRLLSDQKYLIVAGISMFLGILTKEMTVTLPVTLLAYEVFFLSSWKDIKKKKFKPIFPFIGLALCLPLIFLFDRQGSVLELKGQMDGRGIDWRYFLTEINVLRTYLRLFVWPVQLNHDYDYKIVQSLWEIRTFISLGALAGLGLCAQRLFKRRKIMSFCILWFFITTSVEVMVVSIANRAVIYDHWLYLPSIGLSIFLVLLVYKIAKDEVGVKGLLIFIIIIFSLMTYQRNKVWQTEISLWHDVLMKSPNKARVHYGAGGAYEKKPDPDKALYHYTKALDLQPSLWIVHNDLGVLYYKMGKKDLSIQSLRKGVKVNPNNAKGYNNLGYIYYLENDCTKSIKNYIKSIKIKRDNPSAHFNIGQCYLKLKDYALAEEYFKTSLDGYIKKNRHIEAEEVKGVLKQMNTRK